MNPAEDNKWYGWLPFLAVVVYVLQLPLYFEYLTDDTYIYAKFAHNLAKLGEMSFNAGNPIHAATSPLWAMLGAVGVVLGGDAFWVLKILGMVFGATSVYFFAITARRLIKEPHLALLLSLLFSTEIWFVRWSASGMETSLAVFLLVVILYSAMRPLENVQWKLLALSTGLAPLVRPEFLLLAALVFLAFLKDFKNVSGKQRLSFLSLLVLPMLLWSAYALPVLGQILPETLKAKSTPFGMQLPRMIANLRVMGQLLVLASPLMVLFYFLRMPSTFLRFRSDDSWLTGAMQLWIPALLLVYILRDVQLISRYLEAVMPALLLLSFMDLQRFCRWPAVKIGVCLQLPLAVALSFFWVSPSTTAFSRDMRGALGEISTWLEREADEDALVAIYDIGIMGYESKKRILDLGGLIEPAINEMRNSVDDREILEKGLFLQVAIPDFLIDRAVTANALSESAIDGVVLSPVMDRRVSNLGLSRAEPVFYTLYRVTPNP